MLLASQSSVVSKRVAATEEGEVAGDHAVEAEVAEGAGAERVGGSEHLERRGRHDELHVRRRDDRQAFVLRRHDRAVDRDRRHTTRRPPGRAGSRAGSGTGWC